MGIRSLSLLVLLSLGANARADFTMSGPAEAKTTAEIVACAERDDLQGGLRQESYVSTAEHRTRDRQALVAWYNPYSGEAACHVYLYVYSDETGLWLRKLATIFRDTPDVSVEFGETITIRNVRGKVIYRYPEE